MAVTASYKWNEGSITFGGGKGAGTLKVLATSNDPDNDDWFDIVNAVLGVVPGNLYGFVISTVSVDNRLADSGDEAWWECSVNYIEAAKQQDEPLEPAEPNTQQPFRWRIRAGAGNSETRILSMGIREETASQLRWVWNTANVPDNIKNLIGLQSNPKENAATNFGLIGVSVPTGSIEIIVETVRPHEEVDPGNYLIEAAEAVGRQSTNSVAWEGFPVESLRLVSMEATQRAEPQNGDPNNNTQPWDVTYTIAYEPPVTVDTGDLPAFSRDKRGHEYLDSLFMEEEVEIDPFTGDPTVIIPVLKRMALHQIYPTINFKTVLGL